MVTLLAKIFIKNSDDKKNPEVRNKYGILCGGVGILLNIFLFAGKFLAGTISGSIAITADAFNNLSDAGSSVVTMVGFKLGSQKPDKSHPFGHGRLEYLSGLVVSVLIILMAWELFKTSIKNILEPKIPEYSPLIVAILVASIIAKIYMAVYNTKVGKAIGSAAMEATAKDSLSDTAATLLVLIATVVGVSFRIPIDGYAGVLVALFIFLTGIDAMKSTISPLLGQPPTGEFVLDVENIVMSHKIVTGMHDLVVHDYGPGRVMLSLHAEVPCDVDIMKIHDEIDNIEVELGNSLNCEAVIHMDPVVTNNEEINNLKKIIAKIVKGIGEELSFHDFRVVKGDSHTNLIFDVVAPFEYKMEDDSLKQTIIEEVQKHDSQYICVIHIDHEYIKEE